MKHLASLILFIAIASACASDDANSSGSPTPSPRTQYRVIGITMLPTLEDGDIVDALPYGTALPQRGDIIIFRNPIGQQPVARRIIGLPGETIAINGSTGVVSINGSPIQEPYVQYPFGCSGTCHWTLPTADSPQALGQCGSERCYFVLGDNRPNSADSRTRWLVPAENIIGYVALD
jgi:signal peptidase I